MATYDKEIDYANSKVYLKLKDRSIYGSSRVGVRSTDIDMLALHNPNYSMKSVKYEIGKRTYELSNHLGNVLSVISDKVIPSFEHEELAGMLADVRVAQDYSPFGVTLSGRSFEVDGGYKWSFQGQLKDDEITKGYVNYEYRGYDPRLGRLNWAVDPLAHKFAGWSSYNAFACNPIRFVDPDGRAPQDIIIRNVYNDKKGNTKTFSVRYENGNLYKESGKIYTPQKGGYIEKVQTELKQLETESSRAANVVNRLENSSADHIITNDHFEMPEHRDKGNYNIQTAIGSQSTITKYDGKDTRLDGEKRESRVALIHELTHANDRDRGKHSNFTTLIGGVKLSEIHAVNIENTIRSVTNAPKRTKYSGTKIPANYLD